MQVEEGLFIGELSYQVGISPQTIRYYERLGLIDPPQRSEARYRIYSQAAAERLRFIQKAKRFGLSLDEIKQLIDIKAEGVSPCASLKTMLKQHLDELDGRIQEMMDFRRELANRYAQLDVLLSDVSTVPSDAIYKGKICGFIEQESDKT